MQTVRVAAEGDDASFTLTPQTGAAYCVPDTHNTVSTNGGHVYFAHRAGTPADVTVALKAVDKSVAETRTTTAGRRLADDPLREMAVLQTMSRDWDEVANGTAPFLRLHAVLESESTFYAVYDRAETTAFDEVGCVGESQVKAWCATLLDALAFLHDEADLTHNDVTLENLLVVGGRLLLSDFGLVRAVSDGSPGGVGKTSYLAPEALKGDVEDSRPCDVWSAGVCLFTLLAGSPPFTIANSLCPSFSLFCRDPKTFVDWVTGGDFPRKPSPTALHFVLSMLAVNPEARPTVAELRKADWLTEA